MNRRQFLVGLFGAAVGAALVPKLEALGINSDEAFVHLDPETAELSAEAAWRLFQEIAAKKGHSFSTLLDRPYALGEVLPSGLPLRWMFGVDVESVVTTGFGLRPVITQMVDHAANKGVGVYARLHLPKAVCVAEQSGPMRFVQVFDPVRASMITRFDLLGAMTPENQHRSLVLRGERTKARLLQERAVRFREGMMSSPLSVPVKVFP